MREAHLLTKPPFFASSAIILALSLYAGLAWACVFLFVGAIAHVFEVTYGFSQGQAGTVLICGFIGAAISYVLHLTIQEPLYRRRTIAGHGKAAPEVRLYPAAIGGILFAAGCFGFAWTARPHIHWIVPCIFICMFNIGIYSIYLGTYLMISECYDRYSSSGVRREFFVDSAGFPYLLLLSSSQQAAQSLLRNILGSVFPFFGIAMVRPVHLTAGVATDETLARLTKPFLPATVRQPRVPVGELYARIHFRSHGVDPVAPYLLYAWLCGPAVHALTSRFL